MFHTFPLARESFHARVLSSYSFLFLLTLLALVKVLDDDSHEHVQHEETDEQQERDEVQQTPLVVVLTGLQIAMLPASHHC